MAKDNLETKAKKAVLQIEDKLTDISNVLYDMSMKLCHLVKRNKDYYSLPDNGNYYK